MWLVSCFASVFQIISFTRVAFGWSAGLIVQADWRWSRGSSAIALKAGQARIEKSLARAVRNGKLTDEERDAALGRIRFTPDLGDFADRQLVVEAVAESEQAKTEVFTSLDKVVTAPDAIFASNTSSIPIM